MSSPLRRVLAGILIAIFVAPVERVTLLAQQRQAAEDTSSINGGSLGATAAPATSDATPAPTTSLADNVGQPERDFPGVPPRRLFADAALARYARAAGAVSQGSAATPLRPSQTAGVVLFIGGIASVVGAFGGVLPEYGKRNCTSTRLYDTLDCRKLRAAGLGFGIGGIVATVAGLALMLNGGTGRQSTGGGTVVPVASVAPVLPPSADRFSGSAYADPARQNIDEIRSQNPGALPPAEVTGRNRGGATTLSVKNDTQYTLHVFLAGPQSQVLDLLPGYNQTITIVPGQYEIAARVDAWNVKPFYGTQPFNGGNAYGESFYIQVR